MSRRFRRAVPLALALAALLQAAPEAAAQAVRGNARTSTRFLEMRPITRDTVPRGQVVERDDGSFEYNGVPAFCVSEVCFYYRSLPVEHAVALTQDVSFTAWGLGMQGLSATVLLRGRARLAGEFTLPRTDDPFDAILAYAELDRARYRVRLGRQETFSHLGTPGFDGVDLLVTPRDWLRLEAFGGRSIGRALFESRSSVLQGLDDENFLLDDPIYLIGAEVGAGGVSTRAVLRYQREIFANRIGLVSERAGVSGRTSAFAPVLLRGTADYDFAFGRVGKAHLTAELPLPAQRAMLELTARRYQPFFELWTIWGFFSPVAYHEGELRGSWVPSRTFSVWSTGALRQYGETEALIFGEPLRDRTWRASAGAAWRGSEQLTLSGSYEFEGPAGAVISSGSATMAWRPSERFDLSLRGMASQQVEEFRIGGGYLLGGGVGLGTELWQGAQLSAGLDVFRHTQGNRPAATDWNQRRGWMMLQFDFGRDAGRDRSATP
jgi:hypothetical protein